jgi:predicted nucleic acid-binding protein
MIKKYRVFDTNIFSSYKDQLTEAEKGKMALSLVVFYELTATKIYPQKRRIWDQVLQKHNQDNTLIVPNEKDWHICSRIVWMMHQQGESVPKDATAFQNDTLICQSALAFSDNPPLIVTENVKHFSLIAEYLNDSRKKGNSKLEIISAKEYFS